MTSNKNLGEAGPEPEVDRRMMYAAVVAFEVFVVAVLWAFSRHFGVI
jgi:hypothetical protein